MKTTTPPAEILKELLAEFGAEAAAFRRLLRQMEENDIETEVLEVDEEIVRLQGGRILPVEMV